MPLEPKWVEELEYERERDFALQEIALGLVPAAFAVAVPAVVVLVAAVLAVAALLASGPLLEVPQLELDVLAHSPGPLEYHRDHQLRENKFRRLACLQYQLICHCISGTQKASRWLLALVLLQAAAVIAWLELGPSAEAPVVLLPVDPRRGNSLRKPFFR